MENLLRSQNLSFQYPDGKAFSFPDLSCEKGASLLLIGPSGTGKTTLLHLLAGLLSPKTGSIQVGEQELGQLSGAALDKFRGRNMGIVFQRPHFLQSLSIAENMALAAQLAGRKADGKRIQSLLDSLGIEEISGRKPRKCSQGELQRAGIARAFLNAPQLILADEPTSALDDDNAAKVADLLSSQAREAGTALVVVTHDQRLKDHFHTHIAL